MLLVDSAMVIPFGVRVVCGVIFPSKTLIMLDLKEALEKGKEREKLSKVFNRIARRRFEIRTTGSKPIERTPDKSLAVTARSWNEVIVTLHRAKR